MAPISISGAFEYLFITARSSFSAIFDNLRVVDDGGFVIFGLFCRCARHQLRRRLRYVVFFCNFAPAKT